MAQPDEIQKAAKRTVEYLYNIDGSCDSELYRAIATLRQLINEEFKPEKSVSSQFIYDIINPTINQLRLQDKIDELGNVRLDYGHQRAQVWVNGKLVPILNRLHELKALKTSEYFCSYYKRWTHRNGKLCGACGEVIND